MSSEDLRKLEELLKAYEDELRVINRDLKSNPHSKIALDLKTTLEADIAGMKKEIDEQKPARRTPEESATTPKYDMTKHPKYIEQTANQSPPPPEKKVYKVGDEVEGKWKTGSDADRKYYRAKVIQVTGSPADPIYHIRFLDYNGTEKLYSHEIRPTGFFNKKGKSDSNFPPPPVTESAAVLDSSPIVNTTPTVIASPAALNSTLAKRKALTEPLDGPAPGKTSKKTKKTTGVVHNANSWQLYLKSSSKSSKMANKLSQFSGKSREERDTTISGTSQPIRRDGRMKHVFRSGEDEKGPQ